MSAELQMNSDSVMMDMPPLPPLPPPPPPPQTPPLSPPATNIAAMTTQPPPPVLYHGYYQQYVQYMQYMQYAQSYGMAGMPPVAAPVMSNYYGNYSAASPAVANPPVASPQVTTVQPKQEPAQAKSAIKINLKFNQQGSKPNNQTDPTEESAKHVNTPPTRRTRFNNVI